MFCTKCGKEMPEGSAFCTSCGAPLHKGEPVIPEKASAVGERSPDQPPAKIPPMEVNVTELSAKARFFVGRNKLKVIVGAAVLVVFIVSCCVLMTFTGGFTLGQTDDTFKRALENSDIVKKGVASDDLLNPSDYTVDGYSCRDLKQIDDHTVSCTVEATIENDNYKTHFTATGIYRNVGNKDYDFKVTEAEITPKKGIDYDAQHGLNKCQAELAEDGKSCTVSAKSNAEEWYASVKMETVYTYKFDGTRWSFDYETKPRTIDYSDDILGDYLPTSNDEPYFSKFTIRNLDKEKGTFAIDYTLTFEASFFDGTVNVNGTLNATIDTQVNSGSKDDGPLFCKFVAKGNSDGGAGQAKLTGSFIAKPGGGKKIYIESAEFDYTEKYGDDPQDWQKSLYRLEMLHQ